MCMHATWLTEDMCSRCSPPKPYLMQNGEVNLPSPIANRISTATLERRGKEGEKRVSRLTSTFIPQVNHPQPQFETRCVGCGNIVNPAWCYEGSVLGDLVHATLKGEGRTPITAVIESFIPPEHTYTIGGETYATTKRVAFRKRVKGLICPSCAACTTMVKDHKGDSHPVVETKVRAGFLGQTLPGSDPEMRTFGRSRPAFNTKVTQGKRGRRV